VQPATNTIKFTVSWDNGWRSSILNNWDAAWVFLKYYDPQLLSWENVNFTNTGNSIPSGYTVAMGVSGGSINVGVFLYRSASGSGATAITDVELGIPAQRATGIYDIKVFAIEMVYVPQGFFYVGDGTGGSTGRYSNDATQTTPGYVGTTGITPSSLYDPICTACGGNIYQTNTTFPSGQAAFYCMKYELSQGGYRDFLNTLTYIQQVNHTASLPTSATGTAALSAANRSYLEIKTPGVASTIPAVYGCDADADNTYDEATDGEWVACNYLNWPDQAAYLHWAGLRPITELEYEKACRGIQLPIAGEYAWGNVNIAGFSYTLANQSQSSEIVSNAASSPIGNANYSPTSTNYLGPLRNGVFATATSNRISSGGSFYGVMEMSGNLYEKVVTTATAQGQGFTAVHGTGFLSSNGYALGVAGWPGYTAGTSSVDGTTAATGLILRGGYFQGLINHQRVSFRDAAFLIAGTDVARQLFSGIRGGRTAP
jgi:formylglycine-generating enzyme required for sulfatase activity